MHLVCTYSLHIVPRQVLVFILRRKKIIRMWVVWMIIILKSTGACSIHRAGWLSLRLDYLWHSPHKKIPKRHPWIHNNNNKPVPISLILYTTFLCSIGPSDIIEGRAPTWRSSGRTSDDDAFDDDKSSARRKRCDDFCSSRFAPGEWFPVETEPRRTVRAIY